MADSRTAKPTYTALLDQKSINNATVEHYLQPQLSIVAPPPSGWWPTPVQNCFWLQRTRSRNISVTGRSTSGSHCLKYGNDSELDLQLVYHDGCSEICTNCLCLWHFLSYHGGLVLSMMALQNFYTSTAISGMGFVAQFSNWHSNDPSTCNLLTTIYFVSIISMVVKFWGYDDDMHEQVAFGLLTYHVMPRRCLIFPSNDAADFFRSQRTTGFERNPIIHRARSD